MRDVHDNVRVLCPEGCGKRIQKRTVERHVALVHRKEGATELCAFCVYRTRKRDTLKQHVDKVRPLLLLLFRISAFLFFLLFSLSLW